MLIDAQGYIRITDFGLSKKNVQGMKDANSVCGTPEYLAPEILFKQGHGKPVDWWTLGAICYEMLTGLPPFYSQVREELFENIKFGSLKFPSSLTPACKSLLEGLFHKNPEKRLGSNGAQESKHLTHNIHIVKDHPWFLNVKWEVLLQK